MQREIKFRYVFQHPKSKDIIISDVYTLDEISDIGIETLRDLTCKCDCEPVGETNVVECNCSDYYGEFACIDKLQYSGIKEMTGREVYEGDILIIYGFGQYVCEFPFFDLYECLLHGESDDIGPVLGNIYENPELIGSARNKSASTAYNTPSTP